MNSINPKVWGASGWEFMHYITFAYPDFPTKIDKENIANFFTTVGKVLPCEVCRVHFADNLRKFPLNDTVLSNRYNLVKWLIDIHNTVNVMHGKPIFTYNQAINKYIKNRNDYIQIKININILMIILLMIIMIILLLIIKLKK